MKQMLVERTQAEKSEKISAELAIEVSKRQKVIEEREQAASKELEEAEPALKRAKESVSSIQKKDLNEIRSYKAPPRLVQLTLEALCTIITNTTKKTVKIFFMSLSLCCYLSVKNHVFYPTYTASFLTTFMSYTVSRVMSTSHVHEPYFSNLNIFK